MLTLCIVSKDQPEALRLCLESAIENSEQPSKVLEAAVWVNSADPEERRATVEATEGIKGLRVRAFGEKADVYAAYNALARVSTTRLLCFANDDMVFGPGWLMPLLANASRDLWVSPILVEPGVVGVASLNVLGDFGRTPAEFRRADFEQFVVANRRQDMVPLGWFQPVCVDRWRFLELCGYPTDRPFPAPNDLRFFQSLQSAGVQHFRHYGAWAYHFQRLGQREAVENGDRAACDPAPEHAGAVAAVP